MSKKFRLLEKLSGAWFFSPSVNLACRAEETSVDKQTASEVAGEGRLPFGKRVFQKPYSHHVGNS